MHPEQQEQCSGTAASDVTTPEESIFRPEVAYSKLESMIAEFSLPEWILKKNGGEPRICIGCGGKLSWASIRSVTLCLNAQHIGDIQTEVLCRECSSSYFLHYRKACKDVQNFTASLWGMNGDGWNVVPPTMDPVNMMDIKPEENNLAEAIVRDEIDKKIDTLTKEVKESMAGYGA